MAIKGKKKSQARGSQGQRRPGAAPRPVSIPRRRVSWYQTPMGRLIAAFLVVVLVGAGFAFVAQAQNRSADLEARQGQLEDYTGKVRAALQPLNDPISQMRLVPPTLGPKDARTLERAAQRWSNVLQAAQGQLATAAPPEDAQAASSVLHEALGLYLSAAQTYRTATTVEGDAQERLLALASENRDRAATLLRSAIAVLDEERDDAEMDPSGLTLPGEQAQATPTAAPVTIPPSPPAGGGGGGGAGRDGGGAGEQRNERGGKGGG